MSNARFDLSFSNLPPLAASAWPVEDASLARTFVLGGLNDDAFGSAPVGEGVVVQITAPSGANYRALFCGEGEERVALDTAARSVAEKKMHERGWRGFWGLPAPAPEEVTPCWFDSGAYGAGKLRAHRVKVDDGAGEANVWRITGTAPYARLIWQPVGADHLMFVHVPLLADAEGKRFVDLSPVHVRDSNAAPMQATYGESLAGLTLLYIARNAVDAARAAGRALVQRVIGKDRASASVDDIVVACSFAFEHADQETAERLCRWAGELPETDREVTTYIRLLSAAASESELHRLRTAQSVLRSLEPRDLPRFGALIKWANWLAKSQPAAVRSRASLHWMKYLQLSPGSFGYHSWRLDGPPAHELPADERAAALAVAKKKSRRLS